MASLTGVSHVQKVRGDHITITTVAADLLPAQKNPRDILIQNNDDAGIVYLFLARDLYRGLRYTSGGTTEIAVGDTITGGTSGATALVAKVVLDSGTWAGSNALGVFLLKDIVGTFESENLNVGTGTNLATIAADAFRSDSIGDYEAAHLSLRFTSGGTTEIKVGDTITALVGGATALVKAVTLDAGTWAAGNAEGVFSIDTIVGTFEAGELNTNLATIAADAYIKGMIRILPGGGNFQMNGVSNAVSVLGSASNENVAVTEGR